jgi:hypothetical protein
MWALYPLRIAFLWGYNTRDGGSNVSANRAAETGRKGRATAPQVIHTNNVRSPPRSRRWGARRRAILS